jgi:hypothetical protein
MVQSPPASNGREPAVLRLRPSRGARCEYLERGKPTGVIVDVDVVVPCPVFLCRCCYSLFFLLSVCCTVAVPCSPRVDVAVASRRGKWEGEVESSGAMSCGASVARSLRAVHTVPMYCILSFKCSYLLGLAGSFVNAKVHMRRELRVGSHHQSALLCDLIAPRLGCT